MVMSKGQRKDVGQFEKLSEKRSEKSFESNMLVVSVCGVRLARLAELVRLVKVRT
jgi:hypothetical protein